MRFRRRRVRVRVFPVEADSVEQVDKHHVGDCAFSPAVAANSSMAVEVLPVLLFRPFFIAVPPADLLERRVVRGVPQMHAWEMVSLSSRTAK
jgi:hypothetical protein